jgi:DNA-binding transcriptional MocR family regulator
VVIEDDHFAPLSEFKPATSIGPNHPNWAIIRSVSKYMGPDLRMAFVNSSVELSRKALDMSAFTYRWVSSVVQKTVLAIVTADDYGAVVQKAAVAYRQRRMCLRTALAEVGLVGHGQDGINVWIPVTDELFVSRRLMESGWIVRPGSIFRLGTASAIRVTTSSITEAECRELAELLSNLEGRGGHQRGA